jgi:molybdopterin-guanine dinucleotide biosynthesis protein A
MPAHGSSSVSCCRPGGLILAGGLSRRMGGGDKALLPLGGAAMLGRVIRSLAPQCAGLALNANGDPKRFAAFGLPVVADGVAGFAGPLAGVLAGLEWAAPEFECVVTLAADTPFAPADLVFRLSEARRAAGADVAVASSGGRRHHVVALWPVALAGDLRHALVAEGVRKVETFVDRYKIVEAEWPAAPFDPFFNVNTPEDLAAAEARIASGG